ncbi:nuclear transport factor 2 family protein [Streptomyces sp. NPDC050625]|uniref:nuclear transport factor 2 family protein n=1 Tax=Streptomyces sp. NPDC050625 TaxID=3154629 RepID=UPI003445D2CA
MLSDSVSREDEHMSPSRGSGPSALAAHLRRALDAADWQVLAEVLHPNVCWGHPGRSARGCCGRSRVLGRCARLYARTQRMTVDETFTYPGAVVLGLRIHGVALTAGSGGTVYQVFDVVDGLVTHITGYADRSRALQAAYCGAAAGF